MDRRTKATLNRDKAPRLKEAWGVDAVQVRYSEDGHWYATLTRFPAALFDAHGYVLFATKEEYRNSPHINIGKQIQVPRPGISGIPGYVPRLNSDTSPIPKETQQRPVDLPEPPPRCEAVVLRIIRDTKLARELKSLYGFACQVCGLRIEPTSDCFYVEVHHVRPLGGGHDGLDTHGNMLVLCPNHHAMFDYGIPHFVSPQRIEIVGKEYDLTLKHGLSPESIAYHNDKLQRSNA